MKVLFVAFEFPPLNSGGVQRSMKFATYLSSFGVTPIVVTPTVGEGFVSVSNDPTLLAELPGDLIIERVSCPPQLPRSKRYHKLHIWFQLMFRDRDPHARWWRPFLETHLPLIMTRHKPKAIFVSVPPFSMATLWREYAQRYKLPLIVDFRDAWSQWQVAPYPSRRAYRLTLQSERECLQSASRIVCSSDQIRTDLLSIHPDIDPHKLITITNGYDADIMDWSIDTATLDKDQPYVIGYVGSFYYSPVSRNEIMNPWWKRKPHRFLHYVSRKEDWLYRSPYFFFKAVRCLLDEQPQLRKRLVIRFAGRKPEWLESQVAEFGLRDITQFLGYLEYAEALRFQSQCNCLLVTSAKVIGGKDYSIAGKTFEYFSMKKPILGFVTDSAQKDILEQSGMAVVCDPDNEHESAKKLGCLMSGQITFTPDEDFLFSLHRKRLTEKLAAVLKQSIWASE